MSAVRWVSFALIPVPLLSADKTHTSAALGNGARGDGDSEADGDALADEDVGGTALTGTPMLPEIPGAGAEADKLG